MKENRIIFYANDELKEKLDKEAKENIISRSSLINKILEDSYAEIIENKYEFLNDGCPLRDYLGESEVPEGKKYGEGFYCLKKAPALTKLGSGIESAASKICGKCQIREGALVDSKLLREQQKKGIKIKMPICTKGGTPNEDLTEMYCPEKGLTRPIEEKKKKTDYIPCRLAGKYNANCQYLKRKTIITGKLKEKDYR